MKDELQQLVDMADRVPNAFKPFWEIYDKLMPIMSEKEREEFINSCVREQEKPKLTPGERLELFWYSRCIGLLLAAYERKAVCSFLETNGRETVYVGTNKEWCEFMLWELKNYYAAEYKGKKGQLELGRSIATIDRTIINAPPLENDTILYRGVSDIYSDQKLQSLKGLWERESRPLLIEEKATLSTSLTAEACYSHHKNVLEILAPAGTKGIYLESDSGGYTQQEFLLPRNTTIKIYSIAYDDSTGNFKLTGKIVSQKLSDDKVDEFEQGTNNVVDRLNLRRLSFDDAINTYNNQFNDYKDGIDITQFMAGLIEKGLLDKFYFEAYDMGKLDVDDSIVEQTQLVMLYAMYIGNYLGLDETIINALLIAAKYQILCCSSNINETSNPPSISIESLPSNLELRYSRKEISIIAALLEGSTLDVDNEFIKILNKYRIREEHQTLSIALSVLKDAIALTGTRFQRGLEVRNLKNDVSLDLVKTSYQIQEIIGKQRLEANIRAGKYSEYELKQIEQYRIEGVPEYIIFYSLNTLHQGYNSVDEMITAWLSSPKISYKL